MKTVCLYHRSDLDGHCSGAIVRRRFPDAEMIGIEYGDEIPASKFPGARVVIVDFCLQPYDHMLNLFHAAAEVIWIDHHRSAIQWFSTVDDQALGNVKPILDERFAACELAWQYFNNEFKPWVVWALGRYDVWDHEQYPDVLEFQYGMRLNNTDPSGPFPWSKWFKYSPEGGDIFDESIENTINDGRAILKYQASQNKRIMGASFPIVLEDRNLLAVNAGGINSLAFEGFYNPDKHDGCCTFSMLSDRRWRFTLYSPDKRVDLSPIAVKFNGGGHPGACGFVLPPNHPVVSWFLGQINAKSENTNRNSVESTALSAENVLLHESLAELLAMYDNFKDEATYENAYYSFYKGQYDKWEKARNLLANTEASESGASAPPGPQQ